MLPLLLPILARVVVLALALPFCVTFTLVEEDVSVVEAAVFGGSFLEDAAVAVAAFVVLVVAWLVEFLVE